MQEIISLSGRFGIHITFNIPNKETYLDIVRTLAKKKGVKYDAEEFEIKAEKFALKKVYILQERQSSSLINLFKMYNGIEN